VLANTLIQYPGFSSTDLNDYTEQTGLPQETYTVLEYVSTELNGYLEQTRLPQGRYTFPEYVSTKDPKPPNKWQCSPISARR
jgi:hypothetical protein